MRSLAALIKVFNGYAVIKFRFCISCFIRKKLKLIINSVVIHDFINETNNVKKPGKIKFVDKLFSISGKKLQYLNLSLKYDEHSHTLNSHYAQKIEK